MARTVLIAGGNSGDVGAALSGAVRMVERLIGSVVAVSGVHRSAAWGFEAADFLNQVLVVDTALTPTELLAATQAIERALGRSKGEPEYDSSGCRVYRSRTMDIDILFYDDLVIQTDELTIPHPGIAAREFVLRPLGDIEDSLGEKIMAAYKKTLSLRSCKPLE